MPFRKHRQQFIRRAHPNRKPIHTATFNNFPPTPQLHPPPVHYFFHTHYSLLLSFYANFCISKSPFQRGCPPYSGRGIFFPLFHTHLLQTSHLHQSRPVPSRP